MLDQLHGWLTAQLDEHLVEPNSRLGQAIRYLLSQWTPLTLFLRQPGPPLDNSVCERALKKAILHRKNALFFKTPNGAHVGDLFMSLIHTCELEGVNPFAYLTALQRHADAMAANPPRGSRGTIRTRSPRRRPPRRNHQAQVSEALRRSAERTRIANLGLSGYLNYAPGRVWFSNPITAGFTTEAAHLSDTSRFLAPMDQTHTYVGRDVPQQPNRALGRSGVGVWPRDARRPWRRRSCARGR